MRVTSPDFSALLNREMKAMETSLRWQLARPLFAPAGWTPPTVIRSERWFAAWWPYRAAAQLRAIKREASQRLSLALDVVKHGHECDD